MVGYEARRREGGVGVVNKVVGLISPEGLYQHCWAGQ